MMGKKYQSYKKELAEELARNPVRDLLIVNDQLIRQKYFAEANDIIQQMEKLERKIQVFHAKDQKLFDQWYKLTFRQDQADVDRTQHEFRKLAQFHNWIVATAHMLDIDLPDAYLLMKDEERRYENGTEEERRKIDIEREKRDAFIETDSQTRDSEEFSGQTDEDEDDGTSPLDQILDRLEEILLPGDREVLSAQQERMNRLMALSDEQYQFALKAQETSFLLFHLALSWGERKHDFSYFLRLWKLFSKEQKIFFSEVYESVTGQPIESLIEKLGGEADFDSQEEEDFKAADDDQDIGFRNEFIGRKAQTKSSRFTPAEEEKFKQLYRKLIRKLHPDAHGSQKTEGWMTRFWESVQKAYNSKDLFSLDRILKLTLLRSNALNQLTVEEICEASEWLQKDLANLESEELQLKKSMAWGFSDKSERKDFDILTRKIRREFEETIAMILFQIREIRDQHRFLEAMAASEPTISEAQIYRKKKTQRNQKRRRSQKRRRHENDSQESFSF